MSKYLTDFLWDLSLESNQDDESGDSETTGWYALFDWSSPESKEEMLDIAKEYGLKQDQIAIIESSSGAILNQVSSGNKDSTVYDSVDQLDEAWNNILDDSENNESENEDS